MRLESTLRGKAAAGALLSTAALWASLEAGAPWWLGPMTAGVCALRAWLLKGSIEIHADGLSLHKAGRRPRFLPREQIRSLRAKTEFPVLQNWVFGVASLEIRTRRPNWLRGEKIQIGDFTRTQIQILRES